jgi:hypothetical protein
MGMRCSAGAKKECNREGELEPVGANQEEFQTLTTWSIEA